MKADEFEYADVFNAIKYALDKFYINDNKLLEYPHSPVKVEERCITFNIGWYIRDYMRNNRRLFNGYNIDCEYNRNFEHNKGNYSKAGELISEYKPDIIIHQRQSNIFNLAVIELKKEKRDEYDIHKLINFTKPNSMFHYRYGFHIVINTKDYAIYSIIEGQEQAHLFYRKITYDNNKHKYI